MRLVLQDHQVLVDRLELLGCRAVLELLEPREPQVPLVSLLVQVELRACVEVMVPLAVVDLPEELEILDLEGFGVSVVLMVLLVQLVLVVRLVILDLLVTRDQQAVQVPQVRQVHQVVVDTQVPQVLQGHVDHEVMMAPLDRVGFLDRMVHLEILVPLVTLVSLELPGKLELLVFLDSPAS